MRWLVAAGIGGVLLVGAGLRADSRDAADAAGHGATLAPAAAAVPPIAEIQIAGLRHISPRAVMAQISSRAGEPLDLRRVERDVKALGHLGWFSGVRAETLRLAEPRSGAPETSVSVRLVFVVEEFPFLSKVEYTGSRLLSTAQIEKVLADRQVTPKLGEPAAPEKLASVATTIRAALAEMGHPEARVTVQEEKDANGTARVQFAILDGPHIPVGRIEFVGHTGVPARALRHEMHRTAPGAFFASWRGKGAFTHEGFEEDRARILAYCQNHGFPEARVGNARTQIYGQPSSRWLLWRHSKAKQRLAVTVPVEAGPFYRLASLDIASDLVRAGGRRGARLLSFSKAQANAPYSAKALEDLRHAWVAAIQTKNLREDVAAPPGVDLSREFDPQAHTVAVRVAFTEAPPYTVSRIEFLGLHRFSDRYLRRRIGLQEGRPFEERALEAGLTRLARTGYFHPIKKQDIRVQADDLARTVDVTIRVSEAGQQRALFSGGQGQFGSTLGMVYSLFDLFQREELLSARLDAGPENLQLALGLLIEGFLGSRSSLAFSIFNNILRPSLVSGAKGPFYSSQSEGLNSGWGYALTNSDAVAVNYALSRTKTEYGLALPAPLASTPGSALQANTSSSAIGLAWTRDTGRERVSLENSVSGGWLGGSEHVIRSNEEYAHVFADPLFRRQNAWALRTTFSGAGSYSGDLPLYVRLFSGDAQVRGLGPGALGPYAIVPASNASPGSPSYTALPSGANVVTATNAEYRFPLGGSVRGAAFFDLGAGWMLPNWLGPVRPTLLDSTNGILHGSLGFELRWTIPGVQVPVRAYSAVNIIRLNRFLPLPDGTLFHARSRLFALGWALGDLF
ncbi:MAG TPA: POTRA domain-containing protein [Candidatus Acidoferrum sp.]|nr:POTRA domain-containing protein [Candidatus Acidoferrum sp.]